MAEEVKTKICSKCGREFPLEMFGPRKGAKDGRHSTCKVCVNEYEREYHARKKAEKAKLLADAQKAADANPKADTLRLEGGRVLRRVEKDCKPLCEYDARELLEELKGRGYVWSDMYVKMRIDYNKI